MEILVGSKYIRIVSSYTGYSAAVARHAIEHGCEFHCEFADDKDLFTVSGGDLGAFQMDVIAIAEEVTR